MTDPLQPDRLLRKRNRNLQKQLDVTLQILSEEYRQCKDRMHKEERDCGKFLQSLYDTVPDLQSYEHPNTRTMNATDAVRARLHTFLPASTDTDAASAPGTDRNPHPLSDSPHGQRTSPTSAAAQGRPVTVTSKNPAGRSSVTKATGQRSGSEDLGSGPFRQGNGGRKGVKTTNRPRTAASYRSLSITGQDPKPERPRTSFGFRKCSTPRLGKNAYSDHERSVHDIVLQRFQSIFDPVVKKDSQSIVSPSTATVGMTRDNRITADDQKSSSTDDMNDQSVDAPQGHLHASQVSGQQDNEHQRHHRRRVVWSARPHRKIASVSAPDMDALEIPSSETAANGGAVHCRPRSYSLSLSTGSVNRFNGHSILEHSHVHPKIQALALQRNPVVNGDLNHSPENGQPQGETVEHNTTHSQQNTIDHQLQDKHRMANTIRRPHLLNKSQSDTNVLKKHQAVRILNHGRTDASPHTNAPSSAQATRRRHSAAHPPSRRLSEASVLMTHQQLVDKLINAGRRSSAHTRPKTAPGRSELSHRFVPVSRKTIVGILSEIENQKASTRTMLSTSRELQEFVKKLTPHDQLVESDSD